MPGQLQCETRLDKNPKLRKDYTSFFDDSNYKYYFYMKELKNKIKNDKIKKNQTNIKHTIYKTALFFYMAAVCNMLVANSNITEFKMVNGSIFQHF